jgi:hypothetical protein
LSEEKFLKNDHPENQGKFPIFILGTGRCGSTLLQKIINSVDDAMIYGEHGGFLKDIAKAYFINLENEKIEKYIMSRNTSGEDLEAVFETLKNPRLWTAWTNWYNREAVKNNFRDFIESFFNPDSLEQKVHWGFKEIRYGPDDRVIEMLSGLYPRARFLFIVRHPVDVVASKISVRMSEGIETDAHNWATQNAFFMNFCRESSERSTIVRYEDLINKEGRQLKLLSDWLGFSLSDKQSNMIETTRPSEEEGPKRKRLDHDEIIKINTITQAMRTELGYILNIK